MKFFSSFFKRKKTLLFVLLFFVISGIILPNFAKAGFMQGFLNGISLGMGPAGGLLGGGDILKNFGKSIIGAAGVIMVTICASLAKGAGELLYWIIKFSSSTCFTNCPANDATNLGWAQVRNLANMFVVLGFIIIGIATALRIREYEAKQLLVKLIIVALLVNFSLLICGIFIDVSNITTKHFLSQSGGLYKSGFLSVIKEQTDAITTAYQDTNVDPYDILGIVVGNVFYDIFAAVIFFLYFFLFFARTVALRILVILSPLAFVCYVFPFTKKYFQMWWSNFFQWCIIGIGGAFFIWIADTYAHSGGLAPAAAGQPTKNLSLYLFPGFFMLLGFLFSLQTSAMGAGFITNAAKSLTGKAKAMGWAGAKGVGGALANITGASRVGAAAKEGGRALAERAGFIPKGSTESAKRKDLEKIRGSMESGYGDNAEGNTKLAEIATQRGVTLKQRREKAAAAEILAKRKALNYIPAEKREAVAAHAVAFGVSKETFTKEDASMLTKTSDAEAVQRIREREQIRLEASGFTPAAAKEDAKLYEPNKLAIDKEKTDIAKEKAKQQKMGYIVPTEKEIDAKAREDNHLSASAPISTTQLVKARQDLTAQRMQEKVFGYGSATTEQARKQLISEEIDSLRAADPNAKPEDIDYAAQAYSNTLDTLTGRNMIEQKIVDMNKERRNKEIKKLTVSKMRELPAEMFDADLIEESNYGTFDRANLEFTTETKEKNRTLMPELRDKRNVAIGVPGATATDRTANYEDHFLRMIGVAAATAKDRADLYETMSEDEKEKLVDAFAKKGTKEREMINKMKDLENKIIAIKNS